MSRIDEIYKKANKKELEHLKNIIDKNIPKKILESKLDILKHDTPVALITLLETNFLFKMLLLSEVTLVEDMISTGIFKLLYGNKLCNWIINDETLFPSNYREHNKQKFIDFINDKVKQQKDDYNTYINNNTLFDLFNSSTLGAKIMLIRFFDYRVAEKILSSKNATYVKNELLDALEYSKRIRNHVAHNFYVIDDDSYYKMVHYTHREGYTEREVIEYLFEHLDHILKIAGRGKILSKVKSKIEILLKSDYPGQKLDLKELNSLLLSFR